MHSPLRLVRIFLTLSLVPRWPARLLIGLVGLLFIGSAQLSQAQTIRYVTQSGGGTQDGTSWANAFSGTRLQEAINGTPAGGQVWVAGGTYKPTTDNNRNSAFGLRNGVAVYGGFMGTETSFSQRPTIDPVAGQPSSTTLSGEIGQVGNQADNSRVLVFNQNVDNSAGLDGFVLTGAYNEEMNQASSCLVNLSSNPRLVRLTLQGNTGRRGGGMSNFTSSPTLINCSFYANKAVEYGGGMYNESTSNPVLTNCRFSQNSSAIQGGGMFNVQSSPQLSQCSFSQNTATQYSGGMHNAQKSQPVLTGCSFSQNTATEAGGGMVNSGSSPRLSQTTFTANTAGNFGGGLVNQNSAPVLTDCQFSQNTATNGGGLTNISSAPQLNQCTFTTNSATDGAGMYNESSSNPVLTGCVFSQNTASGNGAGMLNRASSNPALMGCSFTNNTASGNGGGIFNTDAASPQLNQCMFTTNSAQYGGGIYNNNNSSVLTGCAFTTNTASAGGGGMYNSRSAPRLNQCTFITNSAKGDGGGMANDEGNPVLTGCRFTTNTANSGGSVYNHASSPSLLNCSFSRNSASYGGAFSNDYDSNIILRHCSFSRNTALYRGGAIENNSSTNQLTNCIFWENGGQNTFSTSGNNPFTAVYCLIDPAETNYTGTNIVKVDPVFVNAAVDDLRLLPCSGAINAGDPASTTATSGTTDLAGQPRFSGPVVDIGAYEFQGTPSRDQPVAITQQPANSSLFCAGTSVRIPVGVTGTINGYQWYKDGAVVSGQTSATLTLPSTTTASAGSYVLVVTGSCNSLTTTALNLNLITPSTELQPLLDLYTSAGGANWTNKTGWLSGCTPCGWYGVSCTNGRVTGLNLIKNNLVGTLPASLSALTSLQSLELGANALTGGIPSGIGSLTALQTLNLSRTQLGGTIPASLGQLTQLQNLLLNESALTGALPASLGNLPQLQNLQLYTNQLGGCFPGNYTSLCGRAQINFTGNPNLPGGGDFGAFCTNGTGSELVISQAPSSATACVGSPFSFSFVDRGAASYQWYRDGQRLAESGPVLSFSAVSAADAGTYQVYINYGCGSGAVQSNYFTLTTRSDGACPASDLVPLLYVSPGLVYGPSSVSVVVSVVNVGALATNGSITLRISRDPMLQLSLPASATTVGSRTVQNALWSLDSSDPDVYVLRSSQGLGSGSQRSVGLVGSLVVGNTRGQLSVSAVLESGSGGEMRITNNVDAEKMDYFNK